MARRAEDGELFWGYSLGVHGRIIVTLLESPRYIGRDALMEVVLDNGESIFCTPDHKFVTRGGRMVEAHTLRPGASLRPLYRHLVGGEERVWQPLDGRLDRTLLLGEEWRLRSGCPELPPTHSTGEVVPAGLLAVADNHKVTAIRDVAGTHDVYCLTVPEAGNFALEAGVFVGNCGIIVNVTPLEPEWRGRVTIEISNTTPLPAKIYAGEGIAQILFLRGDAVCRTSYADKKGKYQDQKGLTLPFVQGPNQQP
jgi:hypothetical protein